MSAPLDVIRECLEGIIPGAVATCAPDGTPNVTYLSQVQFVDKGHVALSYQFFNKTRQNILATGRARLLLIHPRTAASYRLSLQYLRTETAGPVFEVMKAKLAGIASHTGMSGIFRLLGSDIYRVLEIECVGGASLPPPPPRRNLLAALRTASDKLSACADFDSLLQETLACLEAQFDIRHVMLLMVDAAKAKLYTVASRGYEKSGVGSEIPLGQGVIGVAARERTPIRIGHMTSEYGYGRAVRQSIEHSGLAAMLDTEIPLPGLPQSRSQMAVPIVAGERLLGVLYVESPEDLRFGYDDEDALVALARQLAMAIHLMQSQAEVPEEAPAAEAAPAPPALPRGAPLVVRHYREDDSVFLNQDYLIKGVAGSIFWNLVRDYKEKHRTAFSNRELRLDPRIQLPELGDNLEARLILLHRRLVERDASVRLEKAGRGRFRLLVARPLELVEELSR